MMRYLLGVLLVFSQAGFAQTGLPLLKTYDARFEGNKSIWNIVQDKTGILYLATDGGIFQYDGAEFSRISEKPAYGMVRDTSGVIYVSGNNEFGFLESSPSGKVHYKSFMPLVDSSVKFGTALNVYATNNKVYCIAGKVILEYDKKSHAIVPYSAEKGAFFYNAFVKKDTFWISVCYRGLRYLKDGKLNKTAFGDSFFKYHFGCMNCNLTLQNDERILVFGKTLIRYLANNKPGELFKLQSNIVSRSIVQNSVSINSNYHLLVTVNKGAILFDTLGHVLNRYYDSTRLEGNNVIYSYVDRTGNIWLAFDTNKRPLAKSEHGQDISLWDKTFHLDGGGFSLLRFKGLTYISSDDGIFYINEEGHVIKLSAPMQYIQTMAKFTTADGDKLIAIVNGVRICEIVDGNARNIYKTFDIHQIIQSKSNPSRLYVCDQYTFGYLLYADGRWTYHEVTKLFEHMSLVEAADGSLWLSNMNKSAVIHIVPKDKSDVLAVKSIQTYTSKDGLPGQYCQPMLFNHEVLFGTRSGVYSFDEKTSQFQPWNNAGKKVCDLLSQSSLIVDDTLNHAIHLIVDKKIVTLSINAKGDTTIIYKPYKRLSDLGGITNLMIDEKGVLWAAGADGVIRYDKSKDLKNYDENFNCLIRKVVVGKDSTVFWGGLDANESHKLKIKLNHDFEKLTIKFAAPFFDKEEETLYSYQLVGRDSHWSDWSHVTSKEYDDDLYEGTYTFRVKAKNIYDKESREASFSFVIYPPWFRTWWAYGLYICLAGTAMIGLVRWRTSTLQYKKKQLEDLVSVQTRELREFNESLKASQEELERSNEELQTTNDYLKKTQKQLVESEKMASLGQLTAGIAHEINNPINFISGGVQALTQVQKELFERSKSMTDEELKNIKKDTAELMQSINNGVTRTANIINSLRTFSSPVETIDVQGKVNIKECVESALVLVGSKLVRENIIVTKDYQHRSGAKANAPQISQVVINLIDNAVYELAKVNPPRKLSITTSESDTEVIVKIKDNAGGIPEEIQDHIFEPFFTTKEVGKGTGLGLSICYSIMEKNKGKIFFVSTRGEGTEFVITLPKGGII